MRDERSHPARAHSKRRPRQRRFGLGAGTCFAVLALTLLSSAPLAAGASPSKAPVVKRTAVSRQVDPLQTPSMQSFLATRVGNITIALYDMKTEKTYSYRPYIEEQTASIVKVDTLETLLHEHELTRTPIGAANETLASAMIEESDNDAASALWNEVGGAPAITKLDGLEGLSGTFPNTEGAWGETMTTALDQVELVRHLAIENSVLDDASRAYELSLMRHVVGYDYWGITAGPTPGVSVAVKNGWVPISATDWQINSIGFVIGAGRTYVIAVLTNGNPTENNGIETIEGISSRIWSSLAS